MVKIETNNGYDIYELTKQECKDLWYVYPTFAVFVEGETYETVGYDETSEGSLEDARKWCERYSRI